MKTIKEQQINKLQLAANSYTIREETLDGKKHLVVPVVMMVEGVHSGSLGPVLHTAEEMAKWTEAWDGIPVTISHPKVEGTDVSANSPEVLDKSSVGRIFNTVYEDKLKAEAWIDYEKISAKSTAALEAIEAMEPLEVSVGVFSDSEDAEEGAQWDGETYNSVAYNYRPDHLALLPGAEGACSWDDGCGIRTNQKGGQDVKDKFKTFQTLSQQGYVVSPLVNEMGYREIQQALSAKLQDLNAEGMWHYVEEVFDDHIIYSRWEDDGGETLYKQGYTMDENSNIQFNGDVSEVRKNVEYVTNKMRRAKPVNNNEKGGNMSKDVKSPCCLAKVEQLITNERTHFTEDDKEWLLTQEESALDKMFPMEAKKPAEKPVPQVNEKEVIDAFKGSLTTMEEWAAVMPDDLKARIDGYTAAEKAEREALVKSIMDNTADGIWEEDTLNAMDDKTLENVSKTIKQPADYSGQGAGGGSAPSGEQVVIPAEYADSGKEEK